MPSFTAKYQPLSTSPDVYEENQIDFDGASQVELPLAPGEASTSRTSLLLGLLGGGSGTYPSDRSLSVSSIPVTPASSDGVFSNIPAKPTSSSDVNKDDEEMGADEWIFMTPEQRSKLPPPKYSKIKRDRAPKYSFDYTPPVFVPNGRNKRPKRYKPRINALPAGSSTLFVASAVISTLLPVLGYFVLYFSNGAKWKSHSTRLGSRTGLGLSLFHVGGMLFYIPAFLLPTSYIPLIACFLWTLLVGIPFGWRIARNSSKEYAWIKAQERNLVDQFLKANLAVDNGRYEGDDDDDDDSGYAYIEGTDMRVRDLKAILSRARDARLARSLRAAGF